MKRRKIVTIRKDNRSGDFYVHVYLHGNRVAKRVGPTASEAEGYRRELVKRLRFFLSKRRDSEVLDLKSFVNGAPPILKSEGSPITLSKYFHEKFSPRYQHQVRPSTFQSAYGTFINHIEPALGFFPLSQITRVHIVDFLTAFCGKTFIKNGHRHKYSKDTIRICAATLRRILGSAQEVDKLLDHNPAKATGKFYRQAPVKHEEINPFTQDECQLLLETAYASKPDAYYLILAALHTGARFGELAALRWCDVDFQNGSVAIRCSMDNRGTVGPVKTKKSRRQIAISTFLNQSLQDLKNVRFEQFGFLPDFIFCSGSGTSLDKNNFRSQVWNPLLKDAGITKKRIHDCRHTFASLHLQRGEPLKWVSEQMGHSSIAVTADVYGHLTPETNKQAADRMPLPRLKGNLIITRLA